MRAFQQCRRCVKRGYGLVAAGERKNRGFSSNKAFSLQNHSFACVAVVNVERREGPKSRGDRSEQTDHWNYEPSFAGKWPNPKLFFYGLKLQIRVLNFRNCPYFLIMVGSHFLGHYLTPK